jgi:L-seryl-tRNA(Ser) seleniumtransferase
MNEANDEIQARLRAIPPVNDWLARPQIAEISRTLGSETTVGILRVTLKELRNRILCREQLDIESFVSNAMREAMAKNERTGLRKVINATGILLHTGLGRAPLSEDAIEAIERTARGYCNLEFDLETGQRGRRVDAVRELLRKITGAEAATVVNNNAAATILALRSIAAGREVIVSRGQLVEIGGGFRLPEIMAVSGALLKEVGTTNRTRIRDFEAAIGPGTAAILRVHTSNYAIVGFTQEPEPAELARLAHERGLVFIDDIGSGALSKADLPAGLSDPPVADSIAQGADLVLFSGDKLLGGPQCGIIAGSKACVSRVESDPLMRAFRVDKLTLAALAATLKASSDPELRNRRIPFWRMLTEPVESLARKADRLAERLAEQGWSVQVRKSEAYAGGGTLPAETIESRAVVVGAPWPETIASESDLASRLRQAVPAIVGRVHGESFWMDLRTLGDESPDTVPEVFERLIRKP